MLASVFKDINDGYMDWKMRSLDLSRQKVLGFLSLQGSMSDRLENEGGEHVGEEFGFEGDYTGEEWSFLDMLFGGVAGSLWLVSIVIQIFCVVHVLKTARPYWWVLVVFIAPACLGGLVYLFVEVLPEWRRRPVLRSIKNRKASKGDIKRLEEKVDFCATVDVQSQLADAYLSRSQFPEAVKAYRECLQGVHSDDDVQLYRLSEALYRNGEFAKSLEILAKLKQSGYRDYQVYRDFQEARCLSGVGESEKAITLLESIVDSYSGEEARYRLGAELLVVGRADQAQEAFEEVIKNARVYKKATAGNQKRWVRFSKKALKQIRASV